MVASTLCINSNQGFDVIIEHLANINLGHDLQMIKEGARVMVVGCRYENR